MNFPNGQNFGYWFLHGNKPLIEITDFRTGKPCYFETTKIYKSKERVRVDVWLKDGKVGKVRKMKPLVFTGFSFGMDDDNEY